VEEEKSEKGTREREREEEESREKEIKREKVNVVDLPVEPTVLTPSRDLDCCQKVYFSSPTSLSKPRNSFLRKVYFTSLQNPSSSLKVHNTSLLDLLYPWVEAQAHPRISPFYLEGNHGDISSK
jgi:hypothetical protein